MYSDFEEALDKTVDSSNEQDLNECKLALLQAFPKSFINENNELIAHLPSNTYLCLSDCKRPEDIECKVEHLADCTCDYSNVETSNLEQFDREDRLLHRRVDFCWRKCLVHK